MKAEELRIGNLITSDGEIFTVEAIRKNNIEAGALTIYPAGLEDEGFEFGIPLSEDWLLKFGFEKGPWNKLHFKMFPDGYGVEDCWLSIDASTEHASVFLGQRYAQGMDIDRIVEVYTAIKKKNEQADVKLSTFHPEESKVHIQLQYVHQLQNLYFALTGEELTIKQ